MAKTTIRVSEENYYTDCQRVRLFCTNHSESFGKIRSDPQSKDVGKTAVTMYGGHLTNITFTVTLEQDKQRIDLYSEGNHFHSEVFDNSTSHTEMIQNVKLNLFGT